MQQMVELTDSDYWDSEWQRVGQARVISPHDWELGRNGNLVRRMRRYVPKQAGYSLLELGGGGSHRLLALAKWTGAHAVAIDYSPIGIETTRAIFAANDCEVTTVVSDFFAWDPEGRTFDVIVHWGVIEHFVNPASIMCLCAKLLAPGGIVIFTMPNMEAWGAALWRNWSPRNWSLHTYHSDQVIQSACESAGLCVSEQFYYGPPLLQLARWEKRGLLPSAITLARRACTLLGRTFPLYDRGLKRVSSTRGFVARRRAETACPPLLPDRREKN